MAEVFIHLYIFIHSGIHRHLGFFTSQLLLIMLQWTWKCRCTDFIFFKILILFPLNMYPDMGFLDHMVVLFLVFCGTSVLFSLVAAPIYIPTNNVQGFSLLHILTNIYYLFSLSLSFSAMPLLCGSSLGQEWNPYGSWNLSHRSDNSRSLNHWANRSSSFLFLIIKIWLFSLWLIRVTNSPIAKPGLRKKPGQELLHFLPIFC